MEKQVILKKAGELYRRPPDLELPDSFDEEEVLNAIREEEEQEKEQKEKEQEIIN